MHTCGHWWVKTASKLLFIQKGHNLLKNCPQALFACLQLFPYLVGGWMGVWVFGELESNAKVQFKLKMELNWLSWSWSIFFRMADGWVEVIIMLTQLLYVVVVVAGAELDNSLKENWIEIQWPQLNTINKIIPLSKITRRTTTSERNKFLLEIASFCK